ncbi:hypothetical protein BB561_006770 [Smittium simulii]|uniref:Transmembrane protein 115 n=1 Tax=Smittium simulii TaxID=133385 RepID=A0A2T9Y1L6_9FUNG|nr:hypothetical protein BB561_006770 [Smittium simulii]
MSTSFLERNWGVSETIAFLTISSVIPVIATATTYALLSLIFTDTTFLTQVKISGLASIIAGFTVAFKQITPEYQVRLFGGMFGFRINSLPVVFSMVASPFLMIFGKTSSSVLLTFGIFVSWIYLRFYKRNGDIRGDLSEAFSFSSFFPESLQPIVKYISNIVYRFSIKFKIIPVPSDYITLDSMELGFNLDNQDLDNNEEDDFETNVESERRKNLAIKDLEIHMSNMSKDSSD